MTPGCKQFSAVQQSNAKGVYLDDVLEVSLIPAALHLTNPPAPPSCTNHPCAIFKINLQVIFFEQLLKVKLLGL